MLITSFNGLPLNYSLSFILTKAFMITKNGLVVMLCMLLELALPIKSFLRDKAVNPSHTAFGHKKLLLLSYNAKELGRRQKIAAISIGQIKKV